VADVFSARKRSAIMARIRGKGNERTELVFVAMLRHQRITGWRRGYPVHGRPDLVFPKERLAIFVDGCFWHGCPRHRSVPATNRAFWQRKLARNKQRDRTVNRSLKGAGWSVLRVWQHELIGRNRRRLVARVRKSLKQL